MKNKFKTIEDRNSKLAADMEAKMIHLADKRIKIGAIIKKTRGLMSYYSIATLSGTTIPVIQSIERGGTYNVNTLILVCNALGLSIEIKAINTPRLPY